MATANPFDLLGDDDSGDVSQLIAIQQQKKAPVPAKQPAAKLPSKPAPPAQTVKEAKSERARGRGGSGVGRGYERRGEGGYNRDFTRNDSSFGNSGFVGGQGALEGSDSGRTAERRGSYGGPRSGFRGGRRSGYEGEENHTRQVFERRSGTGRGNEYKREGAGRGNWGTPTAEISQVTEEIAVEPEKSLDDEKPSGEEDAVDGIKDKPENEPEKESENKEMTLEEYEKVLEEKRKSLEALRTEERKVEMDKDLASMQQLSSKKSNDEIFVRLGSDKDKRKDVVEKEEKPKKSLSINEFLKPAEGETYYSAGGRGQGQGRGSRGGSFSGSSGASSYGKSPAIEDPSQFPTLGAK